MIVGVLALGLGLVLVLALAERGAPGPGMSFLLPVFVIVKIKKVTWLSQVTLL